MFNVGLKRITVADQVGASPIPSLVLYPTDEPEHANQFGPFALEVALDATFKAGRYPLVVVSHGNGGSPLVHRDLAKFLAQYGAIVSLPEHIGNSKSDNSLEGTKENLINRPRQLKLCIEQLQTSTEFGSSVCRVVAVGHSIGGYTVLAASGAKPYAGAHETASGKVEPVPVETCAQISAVVLLAPATPWFQGEDSFDQFTTPVLMITGAKDKITTDLHAEIVRKGLECSTQFRHEIVEGAGHFSFQSPFPQHMVDPRFPPSQDPPGFDRHLFQEKLCLQILKFFQLS